MENIIKSQEFKITEYDSLSEVIELKGDISSAPNINSNAVKIDFTKKESYSSFEDSGRFLSNFFNGKDIILNEKWDVAENVQGKIIHINEEEVSVDCLIDLESKIFQSRIFPIYLFENLEELIVNMTVLIKTRMKPGSVRVDVYPGSGIVKLDLFDQKENWNSLKGSGLDKKLTKW